VAVVFVVMLVSIQQLGAADMLADLPEGDGIAARYPGDQGIETDPVVVFADGFETVEGDKFATGDRKRSASGWNNKWDNVWN
jgi:hypothetical protein